MGAIVAPSPKGDASEATMVSEKLAARFVTKEGARMASSFNSMTTDCGNRTITWSSSVTAPTKVNAAERSAMATRRKSSTWTQLPRSRRRRCREVERDSAMAKLALANSRRRERSAPRRREPATNSAPRTTPERAPRRAFGAEVRRLTFS